jgi:hypothetical protein
MRSQTGKWSVIRVRSLTGRNPNETASNQPSDSTLVSKVSDPPISLTHFQISDPVSGRGRRARRENRKTTDYTDHTDQAVAETPAKLRESASSVIQADHCRFLPNPPPALRPGRRRGGARCMSEKYPPADEAWRMLFSISRNKETVLSMRASTDPACQWFIGWLDEIYYPWQQRGRCGELRPPANHTTKFMPLMERALRAAEREMSETAAAFAKLWPRAWPQDLPDVPMLPGADDWPEQHPPQGAKHRRRKR